MKNCVWLFQLKVWIDSVRNRYMNILMKKINKINWWSFDQYDIKENNMRVLKNHYKKRQKKDPKSKRRTLTYKTP